MGTKNWFLRTVESVFLAAAFVWTLATAVAMVQPEHGAHQLGHGAIEVYALTTVPSAPTHLTE